MTRPPTRAMLVCAAVWSLGCVRAGGVPEGARRRTEGEKGSPERKSEWNVEGCAGERKTVLGRGVCICKYRRQIRSVCIEL